MISSCVENQTSIITVWGEVMLAVKRCACPVAQMTISASLVYTEISGVFELQLITVAPALIQSIVRGFPTILLLPRITTFFPVSEIWKLVNNFITPAGVQGVNPLGSCIITFHWFSG
jgi:hypothetical protein